MNQSRWVGSCFPVLSGMNAVNAVVVVVSVAISALGGLIVVWGVAEAVIGFLRLKVIRRDPQPMAASEAIRQRLGGHLLLGLEIFIAGDIVSSVVSPTWEKVGLLAAIVAIRTVLSYFLRMEVRQTGRSEGTGG
jgi:uncharacterized membrane protein